VDPLWLRRRGLSPGVPCSLELVDRRTVRSPRIDQTSLGARSSR